MLYPHALDSLMLFPVLVIYIGMMLFDLAYKIN